MLDANAIIQEVKAFYQAFIDGFNREDTDMYLRSFCYPNGMLSGEHGLVVNAKESDQQRFYQQVMSDIQSRGWDHTGVDKLQVFPLTEATALLVADITRYKKDNVALESGRYCYTVRKDGEVWKILTLTAVKPPFAGPGGQ
jgi:ketosteroid isomerase-like protein